MSNQSAEIPATGVTVGGEEGPFRVAVYGQATQTNTPPTEAQVQRAEVAESTAVPAAPESSTTRHAIPVSPARTAQFASMVPPSLGEPTHVGSETQGVRNQHIFLTYSQCPVPLQDLFEHLRQRKAVLGMRGVVRESSRRPPACSHPRAKDSCSDNLRANVLQGPGRASLDM